MPNQIVLSFPRVVKSVKHYPRSTIERAFDDLIATDANLARLVLIAGGKVSVFTAVYTALKRSIEQTNAAKRDFLNALQQHNAAADELSAYLAKLVEESQGLADAEENNTYRCSSPDDPASWIPALRSLRSGIVGRAGA